MNEWCCQMIETLRGLHKSEVCTVTVTDQYLLSWANRTCLITDAELYEAQWWLRRSALEKMKRV